MSKYTSFAVVGAGGTIGTPLVPALLERKVSVLVLTRPSSSLKLPEGVQTEAVDYENTAAVADALKKHHVQVVISTVGSGGLAIQDKLADAAKAAGVKLFVPSEYGVVTEGTYESFLGTKNKLVEHLRSIDLPYSRIYTGFFIEFIPWVTGFSETGKINVVGAGKTPASFTSTKDIAGFIAYVFTTLPPSKLDNTTFRIQGDRATLLELADILKTTAVHVDQVPGDAGEIKTYFLKIIEEGWGSTAWDVKAKKEGTEAPDSANKLWEGHRWVTIKDSQ